MGFHKLFKQKFNSITNLIYPKLILSLISGAVCVLISKCEIVYLMNIIPAEHMSIVIVSILAYSLTVSVAWLLTHSDQWLYCCRGEGLTATYQYSSFTECSLVICVIYYLQVPVGFPQSQLSFYHSLAETNTGSAVHFHGNYPPRSYIWRC